MSDKNDLQETLYGRTAKVKLADGNEYTLREPSIDTLESVELNLDKLDDLKNLKKLVWLLLKEDNPDLSEKKSGKLVTFSMLSENSQFMKSILEVIGRNESPKE